MTNFAELRKKIVIALKPSAGLEPLSDLGALGQRFESFRPDLVLTK